jgi:hypothetical protein
VIAALAALALMAGLCAWVGVQASSLRGVWEALAAAALVSFAAGVGARRRGGVQMALALLGGAYLGRLLSAHAPLDLAAPLLGGGLLACGELAEASFALRAAAPGEAARLVSRLALPLAAALAGVAIGALALAAATVQVGRSLLLTAAGSAAMAAAAWLVARLAR